MPPADHYHQPARQVEELVGRRDAVRGELQRVEQDIKKFSGLNQVVAAREAQADRARLQQRLRLIERALEKLRRYW